MKRLNRILQIGLIALSLLVPYKGNSRATERTLAWNEVTNNTDGTPVVTPVTYNIYRAEEIEQVNQLFGVKTNNQFKITNLEENLGYYFRVTAVDGSNRESGFSKPVKLFLARVERYNSQNPADTNIPPEQIDSYRLVYQGNSNRSYTLLATDDLMKNWTNLSQFNSNSRNLLTNNLPLGDLGNGSNRFFRIEESKIPE